MQVWSWRQAIAKAPLESNTKLVLFTLSIHMDECGGSCYPSLDTLQQESGLSRQTVVTHLKKATEAGFIRVSKHGFAGQKWSRNDYQATYPAGAVLDTADTVEGSQAIRPPSQKGSLTVNKRQSNEHKKAVQPLDSNSSENSSKNSPERETRGAFPPTPHFDDFKEMIEEGKSPFKFISKTSGWRITEDFDFPMTWVSEWQARGVADEKLIKEGQKFKEYFLDQGESRCRRPIKINWKKCFNNWMETSI